AAAARKLAAIDPSRAGVGGLRLQLELALFPDGPIAVGPGARSAPAAHGVVAPSPTPPSAPEPAAPTPAAVADKPARSTKTKPPGPEPERASDAAPAPEVANPKAQ